jgi:hypothetical protein
VTFFFDGAPQTAGMPTSSERQPSPNRLTDFMATREGLSLAKAFMRISDVQLRRRIVNLVEEIEAYRG